MGLAERSDYQHPFEKVVFKKLPVFSMKGLAAHTTGAVCLLPGLWQSVIN